MKLYEITSDLLALESLIESLVDENGDPRDPTDDEIKQMQAWFDCTEAQFSAKFESYCKFIKNLRIEAETADAERAAHKAELDRLSRRAKANENKAKTLNSLLRWSMERLQLKKFKSTLFSAGIQNTQKIVSALCGFDLSKIPEEFLKPRELDTTAIKEALKDGVLIQRDEPENYGKVYLADGTHLQGISCVQGTALVIR